MTGGASKFRGNQSGKPHGKPPRIRFGAWTRIWEGLTAKNRETLFATPRRFDGPESCDFYHTMDIPGHGLVQGTWDLRGYVDQYLGQLPFAGKRALEIGPASGFLTIEMEKRGASVVAVEIADDAEWDFVPYPASVMDPMYESRRKHMARVKNSWWFTHAAHASKAKILYADAYRLPDAIGSFDIAVMGLVLLHCRSPLQIIEQCAKRADSLVITDFYHPDLEGRPVCWLIPAPENQIWDTWWSFSTDMIIQFLRVLGFSSAHVSTHTGPVLSYSSRETPALFTITASRETKTG
jgi:SAM-dependent methyltransferase